MRLESLLNPADVIVVYDVQSDLYRLATFCKMGHRIRLIENDAEFQFNESQQGSFYVCAANDPVVLHPLHDRFRGNTMTMKVVAESYQGESTKDKSIYFVYSSESDTGQKAPRRSLQALNDLQNTQVNGYGAPKLWTASSGNTPLTLAEWKKLDQQLAGFQEKFDFAVPRGKEQNQFFEDMDEE